MKKIILNGKDIKNKETAHIYLMEKLNLPSYYGKNLDALWDVLSTYSDPINIEIINKDMFIEGLGNYGNLLIDIFIDAEEENENISFNIIK